MIPKYLRFQAFASYKNEQIIDFEKLSVNEIFLIHGKTGSGKTSILDAITYALYGRSSGDGRGDLENMRCRNFGVKNIPTEIEFEFEVKGKRYKFFRSVYEKTKRNGTTELFSEVNAMFFENGVFSPFFENPTKTKVNEKAEEIIGLSYNQFMQVVILPQGRFESFLVAPSKVKEEILVTLFQIDNWNDIGNWLYGQANRMEDENKLKRAGFESSLRQLECETTAQINEKIAGVSAECDESTRSAKEVEKELERLRSGLEEDLALKKLFDERTTTQKQLDALLSRDDISQKREKIARNELAKRVSPLHDSFVRLKNERAERLSGIDNVKNSVSQIDEQKKVQVEKLETLSNQGAEISQTREKLVVWAGLEKHYQRHSEIKAKACEAQKAEREAEQKLNEITEKENILIKKKADKINEREEIISKYQLQKEVLAEKVKKLEQSKKLTDELLKGRETKQKYEALLTGVQREIDRISAEIEDKKAEQSRKYALYLSFLADNLAQNMSEGEPCPVCGSIHHPSPAKSGGGENSSEDLKRLDSEISALAGQLTKFANQKSDTEIRIQNGNAYISERDEALADLPECDDSELNKLKNEYELCVKKIATLPTLNSEISTLETELAQLVSAKNQAMTAVSTAKALAGEAGAQLSVIEQQLDSTIPDVVELKRVIERAKLAVSEYETALENAKKLVQATEQRLFAEKARLEQNVLEMEKCESQLNSAQQALEKSLEDNKFASVEEFVSARLTDGEAEALVKECESFELEKGLCEKSIERLGKLLADKSEPDIDSARAEIAKVQENKQQLAEKITLLADKAKRFKEIYDELSVGFAELEVKIAEAKRLKVFGAELRGDRGIGLRRYVLGVMLESVILEANRLLEGVKGGQFRLYNVPAESDNRQTGLDLMIESNKAESRYSVAALSGGEKFLVAISLSMALSTVVQMQAGGVAIDAMFIDEGFGSLDPSALDEAMEILRSMKGSKRFLGIISHVEALKETISNKLEVVNDFDGSSIKISY